MEAFPAQGDLTAATIRPWGRFEVLIERREYKIKRILVLPAQRLSLQRHRFRSEHWFILSGEALVTKDGEEISLSAGQSIDIPVQAAHRIKNTGTEDLIFLEIQTGSYFGEEDIERLADDYQRVDSP